MFMPQEPIKIDPRRPFPVEELVQAARTKPPQLARRALAILLIAAGQSSEAVADKLAVTARSVRRWVELYNGNGMARLYNVSPLRLNCRPRNPVTERDIRTLLERRPPCSKRWTLRALCGQVQEQKHKMIGLRTLRRRLQEMGIYLRQLPPPPPRVLTAAEEEEAKFRAWAKRFLWPKIRKRWQEREAKLKMEFLPRRKGRKPQYLCPKPQPNWAALASTVNQPLQPSEL